MTRYPRFIVAFLLPVFVFSQNPVFHWARSIGFMDFDAGNSVSHDAAGNVYATGYFQNLVDFDPGPGAFSIFSNGQKDVYIVKLNASGNFVWAKNVGGGYDDMGHCVRVDAGGNVYVSGFFSDTVDFDIGPGTFTLCSFSGSDMFVMKLDPAGNFVWAKQVGKIGGDIRPYAMDFDVAANIYIAGDFVNAVDFDPGPAVYTVSVNGTDQDVYILKLDPAGNFQWVKTIGGPSQDFSYSIDIDRFDNVYLCGQLSNTVDLDPGPGTSTVASAGSFDVFILRLTTAGNFKWGRTFGGTGWDIGYGVSCDSSGNVYATGCFEDLVDLDPGPGMNTYSAAGLADIFLCKFDSTANSVWAHGFGGAGYDMGHNIDASLNSRITFGGTYSSPVIDLDPGPPVSSFTCNGNDDMFISEFSSAGNHLWSGKMGGPWSDWINDLNVDANGNIYTTGLYADTCDFDPGAGTANLIYEGIADIFIQKLGRVPTALKEVTSNASGFSVYPNPGRDMFYFSTAQTSKYDVVVYDQLGHICLNTTSGATTLCIDLTPFPPGVYSVRFLDYNSSCVYKVLKL